jgi:phage shock protein E
MRFAFVATILTACTMSALAQDHTTDTTDQVKKSLAAKKAVLVDVREFEEWDAGHLKDANHFPLSKLDGKATKAEIEKAIPKDKVVYVHCKSGGRSLTAAEILKKHGYDVRPLKPGYDDLLEAGFPPAKK